jgi:hypothetical protein
VLRLNGCQGNVGPHSPLRLKAGFPMQRYSALSLAARALAGHRTWTRAWRRAAPSGHYDVVIVGAAATGWQRLPPGKNTLCDGAVLDRGMSAVATPAATQVLIQLFYPKAAHDEHSLRLYEASEPGSTTTSCSASVAPGTQPQPG